MLEVQNEPNQLFDGVGDSFSVQLQQLSDGWLTTPALKMQSIGQFSSAV